MLLLNCPWCGPRDETEYHYGGQAHLPYPGEPAELDDRQWAEYVFYRDNPKGPFAERWSHSAGCRRWFNVLRDTASHEVLAVYRLDEPRPLERSADGSAARPAAQSVPQSVPQPAVQSGGDR